MKNVFYINLSKTSVYQSTILIKISERQCICLFEYKFIECYLLVNKSMGLLVFWLYMKLNRETHSLTDNLEFQVLLPHLGEIQIIFCEDMMVFISI